MHGDEEVPARSKVERHRDENEVTTLGVCAVQGSLLCPSLMGMMCGMNRDVETARPGTRFVFAGE